MADSHELSGLKREEVSHLTSPEDTGGTERMEYVSTGHPSVSFCVKDEDAPYSVYHPELPSMQICSTPTNDPVCRSVKLEEDASFRLVPSSEEITAVKKCKKRKRDAGLTNGASQSTAFFKGLHGTVKLLKCKENATNTRSQMWNRNIVVLKEEKTIDHADPGVCSDSFNSQKGPSSSQISDASDSSGSHLWKNLIAYHPMAQMGIRPFACTECKNLFRSEVELTRHQRTHLGERPFRCTICEMSFLHNHHLVQHQRSHTGERPYQCHKCKKRFSLKGNLNKHQKTQTSRCKSPVGTRPPSPGEMQP